MSQKIPVTVPGAIGLAGQRFVHRLATPPRFKLTHLAARARRSARRYADALGVR